MKTIEETRNWLLENRVDENGDLDLKGLDFSNFNGDIYISEMKVKNDLIQSNQTVGKDLIQGSQTVQGNLDQSFQNVNKNLWQSNQQVNEDLWQNNQKVQGDIIDDKTKAIKEAIALLKKDGINSKLLVLRMLERMVNNETN